MKALLSLKTGEITQEKLISKLEDVLSKYPDLLEEAYLFLDHKKVNILVNLIFSLFFLNLDKYHELP
jgi:hypothetical protein